MMYLSDQTKYSVLPDLSGVQNVLVVSDISQDPDDYAAVGVLAKMHTLGLVNLIGAISESADDYGPACLRAILDFYGLNTVPVAAYQGGVTVTSTPSTSVRNQFLPGSVRADFASPTDARAWIAGSSNIVVAHLGGSRVMSEIALSSGDASSAMSGVALLKANVKAFLVMGGTYPASGSPETNFAISPNLWPNIFRLAIPMLFVGSEIGESIYCGPPTDASVTVNPIKNAFSAYGSTERKSWDPCTALALGGTEWYSWVKGFNEHNSSTGANSFSTALRYMHAYAVKQPADSVFKDALNGYLA